MKSLVYLAKQQKWMILDLFLCTTASGWAETEYRADYVVIGTGAADAMNLSKILRLHPYSKMMTTRNTFIT